MVRRIIMGLCIVCFLLTLCSCGNNNSGETDYIEDGESEYIDGGDGEYSPPDDGGYSPPDDGGYSPPDTGGYSPPGGSSTNYGDISMSVDDFVGEYSDIVSDAATVTITFDAASLLTLSDQYPDGRAKMLSDYLVAVQEASVGYNTSKHITVYEILYGTESLGVRSNRIYIDVIQKMDGYITSLRNIKTPTSELGEVHQFLIRSAMHYRDGYMTLFYFLENHAIELLNNAGMEFDNWVAETSNYYEKLSDYAEVVISQSGTPLDVVGEAKGSVDADDGSGIRVEIDLETTENDTGD